MQNLQLGGVWKKNPTSQPPLGKKKKNPKTNGVRQTGSPQNMQLHSRAMTHFPTGFLQICFRVWFPERFQWGTVGRCRQAEEVWVFKGWGTCPLGDSGSSWLRKQPSPPPETHASEKEVWCLPHVPIYLKNNQLFP